MPKEDLATYEIILSNDSIPGQPGVLFTFQDEPGLIDAVVYTNAVARLQAIIDKINTPSPDTLSVRKGVIHPPAVSVRRQKWQDEA
jgi:hypothetical protein